MGKQKKPVSPKEAARRQRNAKHNFAMGDVTMAQKCIDRMRSLETLTPEAKLMADQLADRLFLLRLALNERVHPK